MSSGEEGVFGKSFLGGILAWFIVLLCAAWLVGLGFHVGRLVGLVYVPVC